jgi:hypothetical protein
MIRGVSVRGVIGTSRVWPGTGSSAAAMFVAAGKPRSAMVPARSAAIVRRRAGAKSRLFTMLDWPSKAS